MQMTWRLPPDLAACLGLQAGSSDIYTLSSVEFAGRLTRATGTAFNEDLKATEKQYHVMRLATAAAKAIMHRPTAAQIVMDSGGFQVFEIIELVDAAAGQNWLRALFAVYVGQRFEDPALISTEDFKAWARVLTDDEITSIAAMELKRVFDREPGDREEAYWLLMERAAQLYLALLQPLALTEPVPLLTKQDEIPMTLPQPELAAAVPEHQFSLPPSADQQTVTSQADGGTYGSQIDV